jgi:hypothetical protein
VNREWLGRVAVRFYPEAVRTELGNELVGTVLDAGEDSPTAFISQLVSLAGAGLTARARAALTQPIGQIARDTLAWAAVMTVVRGWVEILATDAHAVGNVRFVEGTFVTFILPGLVLVAFALKQTRISGVLGIAMFVIHIFDYPRQMPFRVIVELMLPLAGFALLAFAPRRVSRDGRWVAIIPTVIYAYFAFAQTLGPETLAYITPVLVALCFLPLNPAFALGTALAWSFVTALNVILVGGFDRWTLLSILLLACVPVTLIAAGVGRLVVRRA